MIARLRELLAAATPGEWFVVANHLIGGRSVRSINIPVGDDETEPDYRTFIAEMVNDDAIELIVAAHNALPALLDVVEAAKAMRAAFDKNPGYWPQMGWTPVEFDAALKRLERGE